MRENSFISSFKIIIKLLIFLLVVGAVFFSVGKKYKQAAEKNEVNAYTKSRFDDFYALEKNSLDIVFVGSSHSYCTFDPERIESDTALKGFQMGTPLQHADTTYFELKEIYNYQSPKYVVMELYWDVLDDDFEPKQADSFFEVLKNDSLKEEYIKEVFPLGAKAKYALPAVRFQQEYFAFKDKEAEDEIKEKAGVTKTVIQQSNGTEYYRSSGYTYCDTVIAESEYDRTNQFKNFDGKNWEFSKVQLKYLEKIVDLCQEKGSTLVFVTAPVANVSMEYIQNYDIVHEKLSAFAQKHNIPYIDYNIVNQQEKLLEHENFRDDAHLNDSGVGIVDSHFSHWFIDNVMHE
jgi:hypothetical protein